ncbi:MAG TPA: tRNA pseudouridine(55) synthase TruB [Actinomycetota bacterium]|nr:tRNA pseudouridine(55) synthase TruB [Actinomycetota bacterium]
MDGLLVVDKPAGITSHDVVARCRRALGVKRIGHAGTLDPPATGILLLGVGRATRLLRFLEDHDKEYRADVVFGTTTTTEDATGEVLSERDASQLDRGALDGALEPFRGDIQQIPPMVSAVKVGGERLYKKARRGEVVERASRAVRIYELDVEAFEPGARPHAIIRVRCSKGTYIRTLAADIGEALGVGAHLGSLRRTRIGPFAETAAVALDEASGRHVRPMEEAVAGYPRHHVDEEGARALLHGKSLPPTGIDGPYAIFGPFGLVAMAEDRGGELRTLCVVMSG